MRLRITLALALGCSGMASGHVDPPSPRATSEIVSSTPNRDQARVGHQSLAADSKRSDRTVSSGFSGVPLFFERNAGQLGPDVRFLARGAGYGLFFTGDGAMWTLERKTSAQSDHAAGTTANPASTARDAVRDDHRRSGSPRPTPLRMRLLGASPNVHVTGSGLQPGKVHYFRGNDRGKWLTNVPTYSSVRYDDVYSGIDLVFHGRQGELEYDFVVAPGSDPSAIALAFEGADRLSIAKTGDLVIDTPGGRLVQHRPTVYQETGGVRQVIDGRYVLAGRRTVTFAVEGYDRSKPLTIDPVLTYSTYIGGTGAPIGDQAYGATTDAAGNLYVTGTTGSTVFPVGSGVPGPGDDMFVLKLSPSGSLVYCTVIVANGADAGEGVAVDGNDQVFVTGWTDSTDFPTLNAIRTNQPQRDAFLLKLDASGLIVFSTYLGGSGDFEYGEAVAVDQAGNAYVAGSTDSPNFPVLNAFRPVGAGIEVFVVKVDPAGSLLYGTYLGGNSKDVCESIAVDPSGSFYVTGWTTSSNFPVANAFQPTKKSGEDVFISKFAPNGASLTFSTFVGGSSNERAFALALDSTNAVYVGGRTDSTNFPLKNALQGNAGGTDAFLTKVTPTGALDFSTYLGGSDWERVLALAVQDDHLFVAGQTFSTDFPSVNAQQPALAGMGDAYVIDLDTTTQAILYSTFLGGSADDEARRVVPRPGKNVFVVGWTQSTNFPTVRPIQDFKSAPSNVFVARLAPIAVTAVSPSFGQMQGGATVTITGERFESGATVSFGNAAATGVSVVNPSTITAITPSQAEGLADITVTNPDGGSDTLYDEYRYLNGTGPVADAGPDQQAEATGPAGALVVLDGSASYDPNGEPITYEWRNQSGILLGTAAIISPVLPLGNNVITLTVRDGHSPPGIDTVSVAVVDTTPPVVAVVTPNGGNKLYTNTATILEWTASDSASGVASFDVYFSSDGGATYGSTPICAGVSGTSRSCTWAAPSPATTKGRIRVTARDQSGNVSSDASNANFSVLSGSASVSVTTPNTAVNWGAGSTQQIKWSHNLGTAARMDLDVSLDGGGSWTPIASGVPNSSSSAGVYNWTVTTALSPTARVRVAWHNGPVSDMSNVNFTIAAAFVTVTAPGGGVNWGYDTTQKPTWNTNLGSMDQISVLLSTDDGANFPTTLVNNAAADAKSALVTTPILASATSTARIRVVWINAPPGYSSQGTSGAFTIAPAFVTVTQPNGGNVWTVGNSPAVTWTHNLGVLETVRLELSTDGGASYPIVMLASTPSDGTQAVTVNQAWVTSLARVRIAWVQQPAVNDVSNSTFVIQ